MTSLHTDGAKAVRPDPAGMERRNQVRHPVQFGMSCKSVDLEAGNAWHGRCLDLSTQGIQLASPRRFEPQTMLLIELEVSSDLVVGSLVARVVWADRKDRGEWFLGCGLINSLTAEEVDSLVGASGRALLSPVEPEPTRPSRRRSQVVDGQPSTADSGSDKPPPPKRDSGEWLRGQAPPRSAESLLGSLAQKVIKIRLPSRREARTGKAKDRPEGNKPADVAGIQGRSYPPLGAPGMQEPGERLGRVEIVMSEPIGKANSDTDARCAELRASLASQLANNELANARDTLLALLEIDPSNRETVATLARVEDSLDAGDRVGELRSLLGHRCSVNSVVFSTDGRRAYSGSGGEQVDGVYTDGKDRTLRVWDLAKGQEVARFSEHSSPIHSIARSPCGGRVLMGTRSGSMYAVQSRDMGVFQPLGKHRQIVCAVAFTPDGNRILSGCDDGVLRLWDLSGNRLHRYEGHARAVTSVAVCPDGRTAVSGSLDRTVRLWELDSGTMRHCFAGHGRAVLSVAVSADGRHVLSGSADGTLRLWDAEAGTEIRAFCGHQGTVNCVALTPEGDRVVSAGADNTVRLWDLAAGTELYRFEGHTAAVKCVAVSPGGRRILSAGMDNTIRLWALPVVFALSNESP